VKSGEVEILDEHQIAELNMGLLLGVARGSSEPPRLMVFRHDPPGAAPNGPVLGLVGKGITFDTGGISIKPADGMERMKDDMSGGAAVACAMRAIAMLGAPIRVIGVVPATEKHAWWSRDQARGHLEECRRQNCRSHQHRCRGRLILGDGL
jgi:leucyl aminopeptidase